MPVGSDAVGVAIAAVASAGVALCSAGCSLLCLDQLCYQAQRCGAGSGWRAVGDVLVAAIWPCAG